MTTGQVFLWILSNVISLVFGVGVGVGVALGALEAYARKQTELQLEAARKALELKREFGILGDNK